MSMTETQRGMFGDDEVLRGKDVRPDAPWFTAGTTTQHANVCKGLHPIGFPLLEPNHGETCGSCHHLGRWLDVSQPERYLKCGLRLTRGPATDVRKKWHACENYHRRSPK